MQLYLNYETSCANNFLKSCLVINMGEVFLKPDVVFNFLSFLSR